MPPLTEQQHASLLKRVTLASVACAFILIIAKAIAWYLSGSVGLLASLIDSFTDSFASIVTLFAVRYSLQEPDEDHPFGHGKAEPLAGLVQAGFIIGSAIFLIFNAVNRLQNPQALDNSFIGIAVMLFAIVITVMLIGYQRHVVRLTKNLAIQADSLHYLTDLLANVSVIIALFLTNLGYFWADALFAIVIALYILKSAVTIVRDSLVHLMDKKLDTATLALIADTIEQSQGLGFHNLKTRQSGKDKFVQFHLELDDTLSLVEAHEITDALEHRLQVLIPHSEILIHQDPVTRNA